MVEGGADMVYEKIVTLFDTAQHADAARHNLEAAGFPSSDISTITSKTLTPAGYKLNEPGLWQRLFGRDVQAHEALVYGRTVESGGAVLTVRVPDTDVARATSILNAQTADVRQRATNQVPLATETPKTAPATMAAGTAIPGEEVLRLAEEHMDVGKRVVQGGTTRIRRFIVETPVEAQVTLHEEHAQIIRRAARDPNFVGDVDWTDKTIEMTEMTEEPVVSKSVHIAEEVAVRKEGTDTVRTVKDKVRRQQVEVDKNLADKNIRNEVRKAA
jgi:stress response protein YsnF